MVKEREFTDREAIKWYWMNYIARQRKDKVSEQSTVFSIQTVHCSLLTGLTARANCVIIELQPGDTDPYKEVAR